MIYKLSTPPHVAQVICHLYPDIKKSIKEALRAICQNPFLGIPLEKELKGLWKYRVRRYRIVYKPVSKSRVIKLYAVGHRKEIYDKIANERKD